MVEFAAIKMVMTWGWFMMFMALGCIGLTTRIYNPIPFWLVVSNMFSFSIMYGIILPIDFHIFQRGRGRYTTNQKSMDIAFGF